MTKFDGVWNNIGVDPVNNQEFNLTFVFNDSNFTMKNNKTNEQHSGTFTFDEINYEPDEDRGEINFIIQNFDNWSQYYLLKDEKLGLQIDNDDHWNGLFIRSNS